MKELTTASIAHIEAHKAGFKTAFGPLEYDMEAIEKAAVERDRPEIEQAAREAAIEEVLEAIRALKEWRP